MKVEDSRHYEYPVIILGAVVGTCLVILTLVQVIKMFEHQENFLKRAPKNSIFVWITVLFNVSWIVAAHLKKIERLWIYWLTLLGVDLYLISFLVFKNLHEYWSIILYSLGMLVICSLYFAIIAWIQKKLSSSC